MAQHAQWSAGRWPNRFKNAWEPLFHFARSTSIKFNPDAVSAPSDDVFEYSPDNPKSESGSGLLGSGKRSNQHKGLARPSNVIEVAAESAQGSHSAPFPRALVEFFVKAFSDPGDIIFDPCLGSGSTMAVAHVLGRIGYGCEISPGYCDVSVRRVQKLIGKPAVLEGDGRTFDQIAAERKQAVE
ncbi:MAG: site-specific DNA-methyltransferase [Bryobacteraceae bacterium]